MEKLLLEAIERFSLLENTKKVTVALSGGADSMALLLSLNSLKDTLGITLKAAHLNHLIRGEEAFRDEEFVKGICEKFGIELFLKRVDVPLIAKEKGISTELAAREARYEFLESVADGGAVATAHTASDNLETVIYNLTRGSGIGGLAGIPAKRGIFIRPLILCTRKQIEDYCEQNEIPFVTDSTNLSDDYTRNKIRHSIVPVLKEINSSVENTVLRSSLILKEDDEYLKSIAEDYISNNILDSGKLSADFCKLSPAIAKRIIKLYLKSKLPDVTPETVHIEEALKISHTGGKINLPKNFFFVSDGSMVWVEDDKKPKKVKFSVEFTECDNIFFKKNEKINNLLLNSLLNCDKIVGKLVVRTRMPGDSIRLMGRGCTKTLNKLYNELAIPVSLRDDVPLIADDIGVVWIADIGIAQRCAANSSTKRVIKINVKKDVEEYEQKGY
ncbi:MAG: tRNA lysidine(34) synthetase TilS [Clostridia bacterium]|nr:tRNA lysidine(34) synthetase TilS [Clostridia bacterium]